MVILYASWCRISACHGQLALLKTIEDVKLWVWRLEISSVSHPCWANRWAECDTLKNDVESTTQLDILPCLCAFLTFPHASLLFEEKLVLDSKESLLQTLQELSNQQAGDPARSSRIEVDHSGSIEFLALLKLFPFEIHSVCKIYQNISNYIWSWHARCLGIAIEHPQHPGSVAPQPILLCAMRARGVCCRRLGNALHSNFPKLQQRFSSPRPCAPL